MGAQQLIFVLLRLIHIVAGVFWVGGVVVVARFVLPSVVALGPAGGDVMREIAVRRRLPIALNVAGLVTILAGFALFGMQQAGSRGVWAGSPMGITISIGALLAIIAGIIGGMRARPAAMKLTALGEQGKAASGPPSAEVIAEMGRLRAQMAGAANQAAILLVLAVAAMAVARYV